jgi:hypothetical protein
MNGDDVTDLINCRSVTIELCIGRDEERFSLSSEIHELDWTLCPVAVTSSNSGHLLLHPLVDVLYKPWTKTSMEQLAKWGMEGET